MQNLDSTRPDALALLAEFANQGFRKTSMVALAETISISRQTLYNRFDSKEAVLEWASGEMVKHLRADALNCLANVNRPVGAVLLDAFCHWLSPIVKLLREGRHGDEFLGLSAGKSKLTHIDPLTGFTSEISNFLVHRNLCKSASDADELAFLLVMAAKGLMLTSESETSFRPNMARAIRGAGINTKNTNNITAKQTIQRRSR